ncbi:MAG TPA: hypothetical protein PKE27_17180 [Povalibacter sp.]|uniref:hypothetical protein n=1 Tax=Povalibacter sp. TaxID=1962978 RepID=UPI002C4B0F1C|nr:hypothetical protein [Povalibacter sp.]HMN46314.1 hypothetical protein [Povalibacter sp.]
MTRKALGRGARLALWTLPGAIAIAGFIAVQPWLRQQDPVVLQSVTIAFVILLFGYGGLVERRHQRHLDEVELASQQFAIKHGWNGGMIAVALLLMLPPVMNWLVDLAITSSNGSSGVPNRSTVQLAFFWGFMLVVAMQTVGMFVAGILWWRGMVGRRERS